MAHGSVTVTAPATGATWYKDTSNTISWTVGGSTATWSVFAIYLYDGTGIQETISTTVAGGLRSYSYTPPSYLDTASDYYILIIGTYTEEAP